MQIQKEGAGFADLEGKECGNLEEVGKTRGGSPGGVVAEGVVYIKVSESHGPVKAHATLHCPGNRSPFCHPGIKTRISQGREAGEL